MQRLQSRWGSAIASFITGLLVYAGADWLLKTALFPPTTVTLRGVLQVQATPRDPSASGNPPNGYFVESTATERFYVEGKLAKSYVGSLVQIEGTLSTICGNDGYPCYPKLIEKSVVRVQK